MMKTNIMKLVAEGFYREALSIYSNQNYASIRDRFTFPPILKACGKLGLVSHGKSLHAHLVQTGFLSDYYSATALTAMYTNFHLLDDALKVFDEMSDPSVASINAVVSGLAQNNRLRDALSIFRSTDFRPNSVTLASFLSTCESLGFAETIHCWAVKLGFEKDVFLATAILSVYSKMTGDSVSVSKVFEEIEDKNLVSCNAYVSALLRAGRSRQVLAAFKDIMWEGDSVRPNSVTFVSAISACAHLSLVGPGQAVHGSAAKLGLALDVTVGTTLVHMYSEFGLCRDSLDVFEELEAPSPVTWNAVISGLMSNAEVNTAMALFATLFTTEGSGPEYIETWNTMVGGLLRLGRRTEAHYWFRKMQLYGVCPDAKLMTSILSGCSDPPALRSGREVHGRATRLGAVDVATATALIELYMRCGVSCRARKVFDGFFRTGPTDPAIWNAMISGFGRNGDHESALEMFDRMLREKVKPNDATLAGVLSACGHTGRVEKGLEIFRSMSAEFGLSPKPSHFGCVVDLLARCGRISDARELVRMLPSPSKSVYASLLGACRSDPDPDLGEEMAKKLIEMDPKNPTPYLVLSNIYAEQGRWRDVERIRAILNSKGYKKVPGFSFIEVVQ